MRKACVAFCSTVIALTGTQALYASSFHVAPVRVEFNDRKSNTTLQVVNEDDLPVTVQIHVVAWQPNGTEETYTDSNDILVSPPIAKIEGHATQLIRLAQRHPERVTLERAWRVIIEEVPPPPMAGVVRTVLRFSIPIFETASSGHFAPLLSWNAVPTSEGALKLSAANKGNAHIQIKSLSLHVDGAAEPVVASTMLYILPQGDHEWIFRDERLKNAKKIVLDAITDTDSGKLHEEITLQDK